MLKYEVQTYTEFDGWVNVWFDEENNPVVFDTREEAQYELDELIADVKQAVVDGYMEDMYLPSDFQIVPKEI